MGQTSTLGKPKTGQREKRRLVKRAVKGPDAGETAVYKRSRKRKNRSSSGCPFGKGGWWIK